MEKHKKTVSERMMNLMGWHINEFIPPEDKYILIAAPHTSWLDFIIGKLSVNSKLIPSVYFIKKEFFVFPIKKLLKSLGGIPIDRSKASNVVEQAAVMIADKKRMALVITPEGTRKYTVNWKRGFYYIARRTGLPVYMATVDYEKKYTAILPVKLNVDQDFEGVMRDIATYYKGVRARHPENFCF